MTHTEALTLALDDAKKNERHRNVAETRYWCDQYKQIAIKALAEQPQQEPVGVVNVEHFRGQKSMENVDFQLMADLPPGQHFVYTSPPQRKPLTDEEIHKVAFDIDGKTPNAHIKFARAIEAAHGIGDKT